MYFMLTVMSTDDIPYSLSIKQVVLFLSLSVYTCEHFWEMEQQEGKRKE